MNEGGYRSFHLHQGSVSVSQIIGYCGLQKAGPMLAEALSGLGSESGAGLVTLSRQGKFEAGGLRRAEGMWGRCGFLHTKMAFGMPRATTVVTYAGHPPSVGTLEFLPRSMTDDFGLRMADYVRSVQGEYAMLLLDQNWPQVLVGISQPLPLYFGFFEADWFVSTVRWGLPSCCENSAMLPPASFCVLTPGECTRYTMDGSLLKCQPLYQGFRSMSKRIKRRASPL